MKVNELIEVLKRAPQDAEVRTEGCDCCGDVCGAVLYDGEVMLCRPKDDGGTFFEPEKAI